MVYTYNGKLFKLKKDFPTHATTWINLEETMLRVIN